MVTPPVIQNLNKLLEPNLNGGKVLSHRTKFLTKPGENYGSTILGVTVNVKQPDGSVEELELVAKLPPMNEEFWKMFEPQKTFITENSIYTETIPALEQLQREANVPEDEIIDIFPKCYGARLSLVENSNIVDKNATLLLENLMSSGYKACDRHRGFDYEETLVILRDLAAFHAVPLALRKLKPDEFQSKLVAYIHSIDMDANIGEEMSKRFREALIEEMRSIPEISKETVDKIPKLHDLNVEYMKSTREPKGPFHTMTHCDFWVNNMLMLYDYNGKPDKIKIVDFQLLQYDSLVHDVLFFLFTSVKPEIVNEKYQHFLNYYYNNFIQYLQKSGYTSNEYSEQSFMEEIKKYGAVQVYHILVMLKVLFMEKEAAPEDFSELQPDIFKKDNYGDIYFRKLKEIVLMLEKFGIM